MSFTVCGEGGLVGHFLPLYTSTLLLDRVSQKKKKKNPNYLSSNELDVLSSRYNKNQGKDVDGCEW